MLLNHGDTMQDPYDDVDGSADDATDDFNLNPEDELAGLADAADSAAHDRGPSNDGLRRQLSQDENGRIASDVACIACDYNLRGLRPSDACPECGAPVSASLKSDHLRLADLGWLRTVKKGLLWIIFATLGGFVLTMVASGFEGLYTATVSPSVNPSNSIFTQVYPLPVAIVYAIAGFTSAAAAIFAYWKLTDPEPDPNRQSTARAITRWSAIPGYGLAVGASLFMLIPLEITVMISGVLEMLSGLVVLVAFPALMIYLRSLALRIPSKSLAKQTRIVMWGVIGTIAAVIPLTIILGIMAFSAAGSGASPGWIFALLLCPLALAFITFGIWWIVLMFVYHSKIGKVINTITRDRRAYRADPEEAGLAIE